MSSLKMTPLEPASHSRLYDRTADMPFSGSLSAVQYTETYALVVDESFLTGAAMVCGTVTMMAPTVFGVEKVLQPRALCACTLATTVLPAVSENGAAVRVDTGMIHSRPLTMDDALALQYVSCSSNVAVDVYISNLYASILS